MTAVPRDSTECTAPQAPGLPQLLGDGLMKSLLWEQMAAPTVLFPPKIGVQGEAHKPVLNRLATTILKEKEVLPN